MNCYAQGTRVGSVRSGKGEGEIMTKPLSKTELKRQIVYLKHACGYRQYIWECSGCLRQSKCRQGLRQIRMAIDAAREGEKEEK